MHACTFRKLFACKQFMHACMTLVRLGVIVPELVLRTAYLREKAGEAGDISDAEIARRAGVRQSTITRLLTGQTMPTIHTLWVLGTAYRVPMDELIAEVPA